MFAIHMGEAQKQKQREEQKHKIILQAAMKIQILDDTIFL